MKLVGLAGWSGSGKTTLVKKLIPHFVNLGLKVSTVKHAHHNFDVDKPGKDSYEHRRAGATEVLIGSANRWALMHELRGKEEPNLSQLLTKLTPVDLVLVEGFKAAQIPKLEIFRSAVSKPLLAYKDSWIKAIATDEPDLLESANLPPLVNLNDITQVAETFLSIAQPITKC